MPLPSLNSRILLTVILARQAARDRTRAVQVPSRRASGHLRSQKANHYLDATAYAIAARTIWGLWTIRPKQAQPAKPVRKPPPSPDREPSGNQWIQTRSAGTARPGNHPPDQDRPDRSPPLRQPARSGRHALVLQSPRQPAAEQEPQPDRPKPLAPPLVGPERDQSQARQRPQSLQPQRRRGVVDRAARRTGLTSRAVYRSIPGTRGKRWPSTRGQRIGFKHDPEATSAANRPQPNVVVERPRNPPLV